MARGVQEFHVFESILAPRRRVAAYASLGLALVAGPAGGEELLAGAAVSLREPLTAIAREYEAHQPGRIVRLSFGASSTLAAQARAGAPLDLFISADPQLVDRLEREGLVASGARADLARNRLAVVARPAFGSELRVAEDLLSPHVRRIAMPADAVPLGRYARLWLAGRGLLAPLESRVVQTEHARATLAAVEAGNADVAIVYASDARMLHRARVVFAVPDAEQPRIVYTAVRLARAGPGAREFFDFLTGNAALRSLLEAGFEAP